MNFPVIQVVVFAAIVLVLIVVILLVRRTSSGISSNQFFSTLTARLERIDELANQVGELSGLFLVPHTRGGIGETLLKESLSNWLPRSAYDLQFSFRNGTRADAVINLGKHLIVVDSKFPMESIRRWLAEPSEKIPADVRKAIIKHVEDIAAKYIQPAEGTLHFALMYIPAERVYYKLFVELEDGLLAEALRRGVVPVSPGNLFLYLQTVAYGLQGFSLPRSQRQLADLAQQLRKELADLSQSMSLAGNHLRNFQRAFEESNSRIQRLSLLTERLTDSSKE